MRNRGGAVSAAMGSGQAEYRQFVVDCIRLYRSLPALWDLKSREYRDREKKIEAYDTLVAKFREMYPDATRETVKKKFNILRTNYRKELKRALLHRTSPNLWYFREFSFLNGLEDMGQVKVEAKPDLTVQAVNKVPLSYTTPDAPPLGVLEDERILGKQEEGSSGEDEAIYEGVGLPQHAGPSWDQAGEYQAGEYQAVGYNVGAKLHKMDHEQQIYAELLINKVLARGLLGRLTVQTDLSKD